MNPPKILMGAADARFCSLIGMALWMEVSLAEGNMQTFVVEIGDFKYPSRMKLRASDTLSKVIKSNDFAERVINFSNTGLL